MMKKEKKKKTVAPLFILASLHRLFEIRMKPICINHRIEKRMKAKQEKGQRRIQSDSPSKPKATHTHTHQAMDNWERTRAPQQTTFGQRPIGNEFPLSSCIYFSSFLSAPLNMDERTHWLLLLKSCSIVSQTVSMEASSAAAAPPIDRKPS